MHHDQSFTRDEEAMRRPFSRRHQDGDLFFSDEVDDEPSAEPGRAPSDDATLQAPAPPPPPAPESAPESQSPASPAAWDGPESAAARLPSDGLDDAPEDGPDDGPDDESVRPKGPDHPDAAAGSPGGTQPHPEPSVSASAEPLPNQNVTQPASPPPPTPAANGPGVDAGPADGLADDLEGAVDGALESHDVHDAPDDPTDAVPEPDGGAGIDPADEELRDGDAPAPVADLDDGLDVGLDLNDEDDAEAFDDGELVSDTPVVSALAVEGLGEEVQSEFSLDDDDEDDDALFEEDASDASALSDAGGLVEEADDDLFVTDDEDEDEGVRFQRRVSEERRLTGWRAGYEVA